MKQWKTTKSEIFFQSPWTTFKHNEFEMPNGKQGHYYFVSTRGSSMVVPVLPDGRILLTKQYRYLVDRESVEFPAGGVKEGQDHEQTAHHELEEESGYRAGSLQGIGEYIPMHGVTDEICKVYIARDLTKTKQNLDETEDIGVFVLRPEEIDVMIRSNGIQCGMTLAAWVLAKPYVMKPEA